MGKNKGKRALETKRDKKKREKQEEKQNNSKKRQEEKEQRIKQNNKSTSSKVTNTTQKSKNQLKYEQRQREIAQLVEETLRQEKAKLAEEKRMPKKTTKEDLPKASQKKKEEDLPKASQKKKEEDLPKALQKKKEEELPKALQNKNKENELPKALQKQGKTTGQGKNKTRQTQRNIEDQKSQKKGKEVKNKKKKKKSKILPRIILVLLLLLIIGGGIFAYRVYQNGGGLSGILAAAMGHNQNTKKNLDEFRVLLMGISTDLDSKLTDTIIVASYNPNTQKATMLSIPRDTFVGVSEKRATGSDKINAQYSIGNGPESTLQKVEKITGLDIDYYAVVETEALIKLVDAIGGVTFNVPIDMKYDDPTQDLHIDLKAGEQEIDGEKAEQLLRFRHNNDGSSYPTEYGDNDIGRMRTQREFMSETMRQTLKVENIFKLGQILDIAKESIETNIDFNAAKDYIPYLVEFKTENLISDSLPGTPKILNELWFFEYDKTATEELVDRLFHQKEDETSEETTNTTSGKTTKKKSTTSENKTKDELVIKVVDGTGGSEKYEEAIQKLEAAGFTVTKDNAETKTTKKTKKTKATSEPVESSRTVITNQKYVKSELIQEIKHALGVGDISNNASSASESDVSITIGKDFN